MSQRQTLPLWSLTERTSWRRHFSVFLLRWVRWPENKHAQTGGTKKPLEQHYLGPHKRNFIFNQICWKWINTTLIFSNIFSDIFRGRQFVDIAFFLRISQASTISSKESFSPTKWPERLQLDFYVVLEINFLYRFRGYAVLWQFQGDSG